MAVPCGADARMLRNAEWQKMRSRAGGMQIKSTALAAGTTDALRKKGITRNAVVWCPQDSGRNRSIVGAADPFLFREDETIRFPVKA